MKNSLVTVANDPFRILRKLTLIGQVGHNCIVSVSKDSGLINTWYSTFECVAVETCNSQMSVVLRSRILLPGKGREMLHVYIG